MHTIGAKSKLLKNYQTKEPIAQPSKTQFFQPQQYKQEAETAEKLFKKKN